MVVNRGLAIHSKSITMITVKAIVVANMLIDSIANSIMITPATQRANYSVQIIITTGAVETPEIAVAITVIERIVALQKRIVADVCGDLDSIYLVNYTSFLIKNTLSRTPHF
jgi:hypothetical protein